MLTSRFPLMPSSINPARAGSLKYCFQEMAPELTESVLPEKLPGRGFNACCSGCLRLLQENKKDPSVSVIKQNIGVSALIAEFLLMLVFLLRFVFVFCCAARPWCRI